MKPMDENKTPVIMGCDHAAYDMKETVRAWLTENHIEVKDYEKTVEMSIGFLLATSTIT